jgi:hypothetical protein
MSDITKSADAGLALANGNPQTRQASVEIAQGDALCLTTAGLWQKASTANLFITGSFGGRTYKFAGLAARNIPSGTFGEAYGHGSEFFYADSGLTIGAPVWLSATAGKLADAPVNADDQPVAMVVSATDIVLTEGI